MSTAFEVGVASQQAGFRPCIGTMVGEPAGIGPEVTVRAWASGRVHEVSVPLLVGSAASVERALDLTKVSARLRVMRSLEPLSDDPAVIDILDTGALDDRALPFAKDTLESGIATAKWLAELDALARDGVFAGTVMGPISTGSLKLAGKLDMVISPTPGESYLLLLTGPLRVAHLTDHMSIRAVCDLITPELIDTALQQIDAALRSWGVANPRIVEDRAIGPGVARARARGINVDGPSAPDTVFRQCIEGRYDLVLAMFHDQGHIAVKTWGFSGNCVIMMGPPYLHMSVAHGTAYDIVGTGKADPSMMLSAMRTCGVLTAGKGFSEVDR